MQSLMGQLMASSAWMDCDYSAIIIAAPTATATTITVTVIVIASAFPDMQNDRQGYSLCLAGLGHTLGERQKWDSLM